jgi:tRNA modification GTPase
MVDQGDQQCRHQDAAPVWVVRNKIDLDAVAAETAGLAVVAADPGWEGGDKRFAISASRGDGLADLIAALVAFAQNYFGASEEPLIGRERQRTLLHQAADSLRRSTGVAEQGVELVAEDLRTAVHSLGRLLGRVDVEDVLDIIFRDFCIGK